MLSSLAILSVLIVFLVIAGAELLWREKILTTEYSRKLVHICVASFVAFWPLYLSWTSIELISFAFVVVIILSKRLNIFKGIHSVERSTFGELLFAVTIAVLSVVVHTDWIFCAAMLHLGVADGLAALFGRHFGYDSRYHIFGHPKSVAGTLTFFITSVVITLSVAMAWGHASVYALVLLPIPGDCN
jgi:phytol kinase